jgi:arsenate reductase
MSETRKPKLIFLCTGNSARSQMAEGLMRHIGGDSIDVYSAGLEPKGINPFAIQAMDDRGIDIRGQKSTDVREYLGHVEFPYLITLCDHAEANCPRTFLSMGEHAHWSLSDPAATTGSEDEVLAEFIATRNEIERRIIDWLVEHGYAAQQEAA